MDAAVLEMNCIGMEPESELLRAEFGLRVCAAHLQEEIRAEIRL